jgi:uncharacterized protein
MNAPNPLSPDKRNTEPKGPEPSMEEILASIRRIIADDQAFSQRPMASEHEPALAETSTKAAPGSQAQPSVQTRTFTVPKPSTHEAAAAPPKSLTDSKPSIERKPLPDFKPSTDLKPSTDFKTSTDYRSSLDARSAVEAKFASDLGKLRDTMPLPESRLAGEAKASAQSPLTMRMPARPSSLERRPPARETVPPASKEERTSAAGLAAPVRPAEDDADDLGNLEPRLGLAREANVSLETSLDVALVAGGGSADHSAAYAAEEMQHLKSPGRPEEPLVSPKTDASVASAFETLVASRFLQSSDGLTDIIRELVRPMLKTWLDDNLPILVERLVRAEIERVARGGR